MDEALTIDVVRASSFLEALRAADHPPLYFLCLKLWTSIADDFPFLRFLSVLFFSGAAAGFAVMLSDRGPFAMAVAVGLFGTLPMVLRYSVELRGYGLLLFATICAFAAGRLIVSRPDNLLAWWILTLALICAVLTHLVGVLLVLPVLAFIAFHGDVSSEVRYLRLIGVGLGVVAFDLVIRLVFLHSVPMTDWWMPRPSLDLLFSTGQYVFGFTGSIWETSSVSGSLPFPVLDLALRRVSELMWVAVLLPVMVMGRWREGRGYLFAALIYLGELLIISLCVVPVFWYRTVLPAMIPFMGFAAVMITSARTKTARAIGGTTVAVLIIIQSTGWVANRAAANYEEWSDIDTAIEKLWRPGVAIGVYPEYALSPLELTSSLARNVSVIQMEIASDPSEFDIDNCFEGAILVSRWDVNSRRDTTRKALPDYLEAKYGIADYDHQYGVLRITRFMRETQAESQGEDVCADSKLPSP